MNCLDRVAVHHMDAEYIVGNDLRYPPVLLGDDAQELIGLAEPALQPVIDELTMVYGEL